MCTYSLPPTHTPACTQCLLEDVMAHKNEAEFIVDTLPYLLEHSRSTEREDIKLKAEDFSKRYSALSSSEEVYVENLQVHVYLYGGGG